MKTDACIDAYIARAQPFARPVLQHLRELVHEACPAIVETLKWSAPAYTLGGKIVCITPGFKAHCALVLWAKEMRAVLAADGLAATEGMGNLGKITTVKDLPPKRILVRYLKQAAAFATAPPSGRPSPSARPTKSALSTPPDLAAALKQKTHTAAAATWRGFTVAKRRDYIEWITDAKQEATRTRRLTTTLEWLAEGKIRNWKYQQC